MSKWIDELETEIMEWEDVFEAPNWSQILGILTRIDKLLRKAAHSVEDENLHDEILKEILDEN